MWTADIFLIEREQDTVIVRVRFASDQRRFEKRYVIKGGDPSRENFVRQLRGEVRTLEALDEVHDDLSPGIVDLTEPPPPIPDSARLTFQQEYTKLQAMLRGVDAGVLTPEQVAVRNQLALVKSLFLPEYVELL